MSNHIATFLNYTEIVIPTSRPKRQQETMGQEKRVDGSVAHDKVPTMALIDTGAINGNYVGTWIVKYNVNILKANTNKQVCSPINNQCVPCTDSVIVIAYIFDENKINKIEVEIELKFYLH